MMRYDILKQVFDDSSSLAEAESGYDQVMDSSEAAHVAEILGLNRIEWTAFGHGVPFDELAKWRYNGWPDVCPLCNRKVDIEKFGWMAKGENGHHVIMHLSCSG